MSVFALFFAIAMSSFFHSSPECRHGVHMHVIWNNPACRDAPGMHTIGGGSTHFF